MVEVEQFVSVAVTAVVIVAVVAKAVVAGVGAVDVVAEVVEVGVAGGFDFDFGLGVECCYHSIGSYHFETYLDLVALVVEDWAVVEYFGFGCIVVVD